MSVAAMISWQDDLGLCSFRLWVDIELQNIHHSHLPPPPFPNALSSQSQETKLFKEAMQYILPKSLLEPIYHCFYYFEVMNVSRSLLDDLFHLVDLLHTSRSALRSPPKSFQRTSNSSRSCMVGLMPV